MPDAPPAGEDQRTMSATPASNVRGRGTFDLREDPRLSAAVARELGDPTAAPEAFLERAFAIDPGTWLRRVPGRETFALGDGLVVKRYRGDAWREWWHEWRRGGERRSPARREAENLASLHALGLCVPRPLAWVEEAAVLAPPLRGETRGGRSALAMERLEHREHLRAWLARSSPAVRAIWIDAVARFAARLHGLHWFHRDLYLQHFVVLDVDPPRLALLDCGRARREQPIPLRWIVKDLAQLLHSLPAATQGGGAREALRFLARYRRERGDAWRGDRAGLRELARAVERKRARLSAHRPKHVDPRTASEDAGA